jgi:formylmethanofuran dehydrogenase subunit E
VKSVRIRINNDVVEESLVYGTAAQEVKKLPAADREEEAKKILQKGKEIVEGFEKMADDELFTVAEAPPFTPEGEPSLKHMICEKCGEIVLEEFVENEEGLCTACFEK